MRNAQTPPRTTQITVRATSISPALPPRVLCQYKAFIKETQQGDKRFVPLGGEKNPTTALGQKNNRLSLVLTSPNKQKKTVRCKSPQSRPVFPRLEYKILEINLRVSKRKQTLNLTLQKESPHSFSTL